MRSMIEFAVAHRVTILMAASAAVLFGVVSLGRMPVQLLPDVSYPSLTVQTELPDAAPREVENLISRPLEEAVGVVPGLRRLSSLSQPGLSEITLEFGWDTDMDFAALDVREKMDLVALPQDAGTPVLLRFDPTLDPVLRLGLHGGSNLVGLRALAENVVKKELEAVEGVAAAKVRGGLQEELHVDVDEHRLSQLGIPIAEVAAVIRAENVNSAGGRLRDRDSQFLVRTLNEYEGPEDVAQTILRRQGDRVVRLGDVASVQRAWKEREIISRIDGSPAVEIAIYKEGNANIVDVARRVRAELGRIQRELPDGIDSTVLADQSKFIVSAVRQVQSNALLGGVLAVLVLLVFLRDLRSTAIIALAIPTSIVATFVLMYRQGVSLNVMSLGGLALGVGMLVDNSIVVLESIVRHRREGWRSAREAVVDGTAEVGQAVTASTLTTVAVFLPILFVEGVARQIFQDQALTVTFALLVSLVVSLTLTPMLAALGHRVYKTSRSAASAMGTRAPSPSRFRSSYGTVLRGALRHPAVVLVPAGLLFGGALLQLRQLGADLIPPLSEGQLRFGLELVEGTPIEHTDEVVARLENSIRSLPSVETVFCNVGVDARESGSLRSKRENCAELNVRLRPGVRGREEEEAAAQIRERLARFAELRATLYRPTYFTFRTPVAVEIYGYDLRQLQDVSARVVSALRNVEGLHDISSSLQPGSPEVQIRFDRDKLRAAGVGLLDASRVLRTKMLGEVATDYKERDRQIDVLVRSADAQQLSVDDLRTMVIGYREDVPVQLGSVASLSLERGPARIERVAQSRAVTVSANVQGRDLGRVGADIEAVLATLPTPAGVTVGLGGQNEEMSSSLRSLWFAVALAVFLVYLVMASQFESLLSPFIILFTVPLAVIGVVIALRMSGTPLSVVVMIGGIMLAGIVVNNGIVLVDLIGQLRRQGMALREAIVEAGLVRLRPILMTTTTTVLGLSPMALGRGEGAEIGAPLALTVIGGLIVSTLLTLVVVPVVYSLVHRES